MGCERMDEIMPQAKLRSDKRKNPIMLEYRVLTMQECRDLSGHANILDNRGYIAQVKITSVKTWRTRSDVHVHCKYGLYEFFVIKITDESPNTELIQIVLKGE